MKIFAVLYAIEIIAMEIALARLGADISILFTWGAALSIPLVFAIGHIVAAEQKKRERERRPRKTTHDTTKQAA